MTVRSLTRVVCVLALGAGLLLVPTVASAATTAGPDASTAGRATPQTGALVVGHSEERHESAERSSVVVTLQLGHRADVIVVDDRGDVVTERSGGPGSPVRFVTTPNGSDHGTYTVYSAGLTERSEVTVDFRGMRLAAPVDRSSERDLLGLQRAVRAGDTLQDVRFAALPGATVTVTANGETHQVVADRSGEAVVPVRFRLGDSAVRVQQHLGAVDSVVLTSTYSFA